MSKSTNMHRKFGLLTTVSALALAMSVYPAMADEPAVWIEFGWQTNHVYDSSDKFVVPINSIALPAGVDDPLTAGLRLKRSYGEFGSIAFRPSGTSWVFSASVVYGRSGGKRREAIDHNETLPATPGFVAYHRTAPGYPSFQTTQTQSAPQKVKLIHVEKVTAESHHMVDFEAGHDVGLGIFGEHGTSTLNVGIRFAQLRSSLNVANFQGVPDIHFEHFDTNVSLDILGSRTIELHQTGTTENWTVFAGNGKSAHDFSGYGPSMHWDASASLWGNPNHGGEVSLNWGVGGALLFGKQKNKAEHKTFAENYCDGAFCESVPLNPHNNHYSGLHYEIYQLSGSARSEKRVTIPNLGGSIGISYRFQDIKLSAGYHGDFFFRAIDTGTGHSITRGFQGPYASVSIGVGD